MKQYNNSYRVMEADAILKNGRSMKSQTSKGNQFLDNTMKFP